MLIGLKCTDPIVQNGCRSYWIKYTVLNKDPPSLHEHTHRASKQESSITQTIHSEETNYTLEYLFFVQCFPHLAFVFLLLIMPLIVGSSLWSQHLTENSLFMNHDNVHYCLHSNENYQDEWRVEKSSLYSSKYSSLLAWEPLIINEADKPYSEIGKAFENEDFFLKLKEVG